MLYLGGLFMSMLVKMWLWYICPHKVAWAVKHQVLVMYQGAL